MSELRNQLPDNERLTTADIVNPEQAKPVQPAAFDDVPFPPRPGVPVTGRSAEGQAEPLFPEDEMNSFRARWEEIQTSFVDEPRRAVEQADNLVANAVKRIAEQFSAERAQLEGQWDRGDNISTEDLRQTLKRYRSFFHRLLTY